MRKLTVRNFSCVNEATLVLGALTVIIGPQASGKSLLSKLNYFFNELLREQTSFIEDRKEINFFKEYIKEKFQEWFPPSAWGGKKFCIEFEAGDFQVRLSRSEYRGRLSENIRLSTSDFFDEQYNKLLEMYEKLLTKKVSEDRRFEIVWQVIETSDKALKSHLQGDYASYQLFIPAGRSFFTSIGKAVVAFEQTQMLDPLTSAFGRIYASYRERVYRFRQRMRSKNIEDQLMEKIFGGNVKIERGKEYVVTHDGRKIPFSALSSGQQELMPLLVMLSAVDDRVIRKDTSRQLIYIEEPEAHLFPTAQSILVEALANIISRSKGTINMVVTTHSPYVLAKLNNLIKAGTLASSASESTISRIRAVVPQNAWLAPGMVNAYAIEEGELRSIINDDRLVDAAYLDDVSGAIAKEFSSLLEIEIA